jgi:hypothetical protein
MRHHGAQDPAAADSYDGYSRTRNWRNPSTAFGHLGLDGALGHQRQLFEPGDVVVGERPCLESRRGREQHPEELLRISIAQRCLDEVIVDVCRLEGLLDAHLAFDVRHEVEATGHPIDSQVQVVGPAVGVLA